MTNYLDRYIEIFNGEPFLRDDKIVTRNEYKAFDGGAVRKLIVPIFTELEKRKSVTILDYGCGTAIHWHKRTIEKQYTLPEKIGMKLQGFYRYDPAVEEFNTKPQGKFDFVFCTDVLEHIPESDLSSILSDLNEFCKKDGVVFITTSTKLSKNFFADGTNMHITLKTPDEWKELIEKYIDKKKILMFD